MARELVPGIHWIGGWLSSLADLNISDETEFSSLAVNQTHLSRRKASVESHMRLVQDSDNILER
jgi:hypothetical protein